MLSVFGKAVLLYVTLLQTILEAPSNTYLAVLTEERK